MNNPTNQPHEWDRLDKSLHDMRTEAERRAAIEPTETVINVCDRCSLPVMPNPTAPGTWMHSEAADEVFCALIFPA